MGKPWEFYLWDTKWNKDVMGGDICLIQNMGCYNILRLCIQRQVLGHQTNHVVGTYWGFIDKVSTIKGDAGFLPSTVFLEP